MRGISDIATATAWLKMIVEKVARLKALSLLHHHHQTLLEEKWMEGRFVV